MLNMFRFIVVCAVLAMAHGAFGQDFSNKGKDFWIAYPAHVDGTLSKMGLYITSDVAASGTVLVGGTTLSFSITPNTVRRFFIGSGGTDDASNVAAYLGQSDGIATGAGVRVLSNAPVVVYAHIIRSARSGASLILPSHVWGREYLVPSFGSSGASGTNSGFGEIAVMAKEPNTLIEITPAKATRSGKPAGTPYTITLANPGDVYQVQFNKDDDISGTKVRSIASGTSGCQPIAVFSASTWSAFDCAGASGGDNLYQQLFPVRSFGRSFLTAPFVGRNYDIVRVFVTDPTTVVSQTIGGVTTTLTGLTAGSFYQYTTNQPSKIDADKPVSVVQYITSQSCFNASNPSDPEMVILNPVEQTINNITVFSAHQNFVPAGQSNVNRCYLNVIIKSVAAPTFKINGGLPSGVFQTIPGTQFSYLQENVTAVSTTNPVQTLTADSSFSCIAYGYGNVESYGYNAGTNVRDLYQYVTINNPSATVNFPATCVQTPFFFGITLPYQPTALKWLFYGAYPDVNIPSPVADSVFQKDGKTLYQYKLKTPYQYNAIGTYKVTVVATTTNADGCNGEQEIDYDLEVFQKPKANFNWTHNGCLSDSVRFADTSNGLGRTVIKWRWEFGDGMIDSVKNPVKKYAVANTYTIKQTITTDVGCSADTSKTILISNPPVALFGVQLPACPNVPVQFTDLSNLSNGTIALRYWDFGNGQKDTTTNNSNRTVVYTTPGSYVVRLVVVSSTGCISAAYTKTIVISPTPIVDFTLPGNVCLPAGLATFKNTSTVATGGFASYLWQFGDGGTSTVKDPSYLYSATGTFNVSLKATTDSGCHATTVKPFSSIFTKPKANFTAPAELCLRDTAALVDGSTAGNQSFVKYVWQLGDNTTDTLKNTNKLYVLSGSYTIKHWAITDKGCFSDTATKTLTINALPIVAFSNTAPACETRQITLNTQSTTAAGNITRWYWTLGDGTVKDQNNGNAFTHNYASSGNQLVTLAVSTDKGCKSDTLKKMVMINALPKINYPLPEVCLSDAFAQFVDSSTISDGSSAQFVYAWTFGDASSTPTNPNTSTLRNPKHRYSASGNYNVLLKITSKDGCVDSLAKVLVVNGDKPKADFTVVNVGNICATDLLQIKDNSTVNFGVITKVVVYWEWPNAAVLTTDDNPVVGEVYSRPLADFISPASKTFQVRYLAYSGGVCVDEIIKSITVNARPKAVFTRLPGICVDAAPRQFNQASNTGVVTGSGTYSGPGVNASGLFTPAVAGVGTHTIRYRFVSVAGCIDSAKQTITVWPRPTAGFSIDSPTCVTQAITLRDASIPNANQLVKWDWNFGNGTTAVRTTALPFAQTYASTGNYTVTLQVTTDSGCVSNAATKAFIVNPLPVVEFDLPTVCLPVGLARFTDKSTIADGSAAQFAYLWNFGVGTATSTLKNPTFNYTAAGSYAVALRVTSKNGCVTTTTKQLTDVNPQPLANFESNPGSVCLGDVINFTDRSNPLSQTIVTYRWAFGDNATSTLQNPNHRYSATGTYQVSMNYTTNKGCTSDTVVKSVIVHPYPVVNAGADFVVLEGGQKPLLATVSGGSNYQYQWLPVSFLNDPAVLQPVTTPKNDVTYTLTVTSLGGCTSSDDVFVKLLLKPEIPNAFSPNGDGINDTWTIKYLDSYPGATVQLFDRYGRQVLNSVGYNRAWDGKQNGVVVPIGVYYYIVDPKNGRSPITGSVTVLK